ncbi:MAG: ABC transporter permease [Chthoniobacterales bacterium]|nr:ABC transporter permease [Chthoniobacterales bacterium]
MNSRSSSPVSTEKREQRARLRVYTARATLCFIFTIGWELGSGRFLDPFYFSSPSKVVLMLANEFGAAGFWNDLRVTSTELLLGFLGGASAGVLTGHALGRWQFLCAVLEPFLVALNSIPRIALAPLLVIWFGIDLASKVVLAASLVYFITFFNTLAGVRGVDAGLLSVARIQGANDRQLFLKVVLPSASSWIFTGLKLSLPFALIGVIVGEFMAASSGIGYRLNMYSTSYNTTGTMAMLAVMMFFMLLLNGVMDLSEARLMRWRPKPTFGLERSFL